MKKPDYEDIVTNMEQPILVLAGPGAGKTYLLGDRVNRLLRKGVSKENITVLTFGKDASIHMRSKLLDQTDGFGLKYENLPHISTMHSLGFEIVKHNLRHFNLKAENLNILDDGDVKSLLLRDATLILGFNKENGQRVFDCKINGDCNKDTERRKCRICMKYRQIMAYCNYLDYDDQILFACELLEYDARLLNDYQERSQNLLVDEYQDINAAQYRLIEILSRKSRNGLFAVGDDAQSIYGFRGCTPDFILNFDKKFRGALTPPLNHSRRCHENIIKNAEKVLLEYYPSWSGPFEIEFHVQQGDEPKVFNVKSEIAEAELVTQISRNALNEKKSVLVLVPKKDFFRRLSYDLRKFGIPHICPNNLLFGWANDRLQVIKQLINWVKEPEDNFKTRLAIEALINHGNCKIPGGDNPTRCNPDTLGRRLNIETEIAFLWDNVDKKVNLHTVLNNTSKISEDLENVRNMLNNLKDLSSKSTSPYKGEFVKQLILSTGVWIDPEKLVDDFSAITEILNYTPPSGSNVVQIMTMRKAKGLEADVVIMIGLEDDIVPNPKSSLEEEARLFYVSMTRAKEELILIHSFQRPRNISFGPDIFKKQRSRFIDSIGKRSIFIK